MAHKSWFVNRLINIFENSCSIKQFFCWNYWYDENIFKEYVENIVGLLKFERVTVLKKSDKKDESYAFKPAVHNVWKKHNWNFDIYYDTKQKLMETSGFVDSTKLN